jgi:hypothetical protein
LLKEKFLPMREWLELGQELNDRQRVFYRRYFRAYDTHMIEIGPGAKIKADGKTYGPGRYRLESKWTRSWAK